MAELFGNIGQKKNPESTEVVFSNLKKLIEEGPPIVKLILTNAEGRVSRISVLLEQIKKAMDNSSNNQDKVAELTAEIKGLTKTITEKDAEITKLMKDATDSSGQSEKDKSKIKDLEQKLTDEKKACTTKMKELVGKLTDANNRIKADQTAAENKYAELEDQIKSLSDKATLTKSSSTSYADAASKPASSTFGANTSTSKPIPIRGRKPSQPTTNSRPAFNSNTKVKKGEFGFGGRRRRTKKGRKSRRGKKTRRH
jgi:chromosome segregation ATPase